MNITEKWWMLVSNANRTSICPSLTLQHSEGWEYLCSVTGTLQHTEGWES